MTNNNVLAGASLPSIEATILHHRLRWAGHVARMDPERLPRMILFSELSRGKRPHGGPKRRYKDQLKTSLRQTGLSPETWETSAQDRGAWRQLVKKGVALFEAERLSRDERRRQERKARQRQQQLNHRGPVAS